MLDDVRTLHAKFDLGIATTPSLESKQKLNERLDFLFEELEEMDKAYRTGDFPGIADALVDLVVVALGTAIQLGLPWDELWNDVQRANLAKVRGVGPRGHAVDLIKPEGWVPPQTLEILRKAGWVL